MSKKKVEWTTFIPPEESLVRKLTGVADSVGISMVATVPCLYQGWECDPWVCVVRDTNMNRYLLQSNHGRWELGAPEDLSAMILKYSEASQLAVKGLIELTEGKQAELAKWQEKIKRGEA